MTTEANSRRIAVTGATGRVGVHLVEILEQRGHEVVPIARSKGVDVISGEGLDQALEGTDTIIDTATGNSPDQKAATEFFTTSARNLQRAGAAARREGNHRRLDHRNRRLPRRLQRREAGSGAHTPRGPAPRADRSRRPVPRVRRTARRLDGRERRSSAAGDADAARGGPFRLRGAGRCGGGAGPRKRQDHRGRRPPGGAARRCGSCPFASRGDSTEVREERESVLVSGPDDPDAAAYARGAVLPGPDAKLVGPTFEEWLSAAA